MKEREKTVDSDKIFEELSRKKDIQSLKEKLEKMSTVDLILLKLYCHEKIEESTIYQTVVTPISIILSAFWAVIGIQDWSGLGREPAYWIGLAVCAVVFFGIFVVVLIHSHKAEKGRKILNMIEELEKYGLLKK